jgi:hypothetical protein
MGLRTGDGLRAYYQGKIEAAEVAIRDRQHDLGRMEAQRNELNTKGAPSAAPRARARGAPAAPEPRRARRRAPRAAPPARRP